jgi:hypothetical protein
MDFTDFTKLLGHRRARRLDSYVPREVGDLPDTGLIRCNLGGLYLEEGKLHLNRAVWTHSSLGGHKGIFRWTSQRPPSELQGNFSLNCQSAHVLASRPLTGEVCAVRTWLTWGSMRTKVLPTYLRIDPHVSHVTPA